MLEPVGRVHGGQGGKTRPLVPAGLVVQVDRAHHGVVHAPQPEQVRPHLGVGRAEHLPLHVEDRALPLLAAGDDRGVGIREIGGHDQLAHVMEQAGDKALFLLGHGHPFQGGDHPGQAPRGQTVAPQLFQIEIPEGVLVEPVEQTDRQHQGCDDVESEQVHGMGRARHVDAQAEKGRVDELQDTGRHAHILGDEPGHLPHRRLGLTQFVDQGRIEPGDRG